jgi:hypothetical protein
MASVIKGWSYISDTGVRNCPETASLGTIPILACRHAKLPRNCKSANKTHYRMPACKKISHSDIPTCAETHCLRRLTRARLAVSEQFRMPVCEVIAPHIVVLKPENNTKVMIAGGQLCYKIQIQTVQRVLHLKPALCNLYAKLCFCYYCSASRTNGVRRKCRKWRTEVTVVQLVARLSTVSYFSRKRM